MRKASCSTRALGLVPAVAIILLGSGCGSSHPAHVTDCPVTKPGGPRPPRYALLNFGTPITNPSDPSLYGNGTLWTGLPRAQTVARDPRTGMIGVKLGWFRARRGLVTITAKPWRGPAARFRAWVGTPQEYGPTGFAASGLTFGRAGCWQLRARLAGRVLKLVLYVPPARPLAAVPVGPRSPHRAGTVQHPAAVRVLPCRETIGADPPGAGMTVVLGVVALPTSPHLRRALQRL